MGIRALAAFLVAASYCVHPELVAADAPDAGIFSRVMVIGASASAGFVSSPTSNGPVAGQLQLNRYLDAALLMPHQKVPNYANVLLFLQPEATARRELAQALPANPSLLIGPDFLFWFCYGSVGPNETRASRLETGLQLLEAVSCPLLIGNIPDASGADPNMLPRDYIPTKAEMDAANRRIRDWAAKHKNVMVVDLAKLMGAAAANQALNVHGNKWAAGASRALLQDDGLHPTPAGCAMLTLASLDAIRASQKAIPSSAIRWDAKEIQRIVLTEALAVPNRPPVVATPN